MGRIGASAVAALCFTAAWSAARAAEKPESKEPKLLSVFPSAGQPGTKVQAEVRAQSIAGAYALRFEDTAVTGHVLKVEALPAEKDLPRLYRAAIEVAIGPGATGGDHFFRLVSPAGLSNALPFCVSRERVIVERATAHQTATQAEPITLPAIINGRLDAPGQLDYYSFESSEGRQVSVQVSRAENMEAYVALYRPGGSWFDPDRPTRLLFEEDRTSDLMPVGARGTLRVTRDGRYLMEVSSIYGKGSPDSSYLLRIARNQSPSEPEKIGRAPAAEWKERSFARPLDASWMTALENRSVSHDTLPTPAVIRESGAKIPIPSMIEGSIERPGEMDRFLFEVKAGQRLAFEIETPGCAPPLFNPRLAVVDSKDHELFSNVHRRVSLFNNNADRQVYLKGIEPKAIYTFDQAGQYVLQIRDITSRYGGADYRYRILVRPQIAHVGEVSTGESDRVNLVRGQARKLTLLTSHEEGFGGDVLFTFTGLPEGVDAFPAAEPNDKRAPTDIDEDADAVAPKLQTTTVVLMAAANAPLTAMPKDVQLLCRPVAGGRPGPSLLVRRIPLMVVAEAAR